MEIIIMELLGPSLESLLERNKKPFSTKCVLMLADEIVHPIIRLKDSNRYMKRELSTEISNLKIFSLEKIILVFFTSLILALLRNTSPAADTMQKNQ
jgi:hypothetical protein